MQLPDYTQDSTMTMHTDTDRSQRLSGLLDRLRAKGLRMTPQRLAILRALVMHHGHPTAEELHTALRDSFPTMSLATVYKTIALLKRHGEIIELEFSGRDNRFDGFNARPHPHLICTSCGKVMDPDVPGLRHMISDLAERTGFAVTSHRLDVYGTCPDCQKKR